MYFKPVTQRSTDKFILLLVRGEPDECWPWSDAAVRVDYYGIICGVKSNRVAYTALIGVIPDGMIIRHTCDHKWCVNPVHLVAGTHSQNLQDVLDRHPTVHEAQSASRRGERNPRARLTTELVLQMRAEYASGIGNRDLAGSYGVSIGCVDNIISRANWKHV